MKTVEENFLEFYSNYYGEVVDNLAQIQGDILDGKEQLDFVSAFANQNKWIGCEDRLPENKNLGQEYCLVYEPNRGISVHPYSHHHLCWDTEDGDDYYTDAKGGKITHWMPLPAKPK